MWTAGATIDRHYPPPSRLFLRFASFAFQGTNAHALLGADEIPSSPGASSAAKALKPLALQKRRFWPFPNTAAFLLSASPAGPRVTVTAHLDPAWMAAVSDHKVLCLGRERGGICLMILLDPSLFFFIFLSV